MTITCFYQQAGANPDAEINLVKLWEKAWKYIGWNPITLTESDAKTHPLYDQMVAYADSLPHVTDTFYHRYVFIRWLAFAQIGGATADYDVFPRQRFVFEPVNHSVNGSLNLQPGFLYAPKSWYERYLQRILTYKPTEHDLFERQPHVCDMIIMQRSEKWFDEIRDLVRLVNEPNWRNVPLVHFCNESFRHRYQGVRALLDL